MPPVPETAVCQALVFCQTGVGYFASGPCVSEAAFSYTRTYLMTNFCGKMVSSFLYS